MKPQTILRNIIWHYQKAQLGEIGKNANVNLLADVRGRKKSIFIGEGSTICKYATLEVDTVDVGESKIVIGNNTLISSFVIIRTHGGTIKIGNSCFVNSFTVLHGHGDLTIGNSCLIGPQVTMVPANNGFKDRNTPIKLQTPTRQGITIEDDVWIGAGVTILDGCTIGKGCVIGAGAVVTRSLDPYSIVAGSAAKKIEIRE
ncbi:MAG: acyltransferase [Oscillatoriales cyanobacterium C42_A2020_001]|nr:acyltransferase [Leptolyngbyaceae cyanobacterium C42_A2020_001]